MSDQTASTPDAVASRSAGRRRRGWGAFFRDLLVIVLIALVVSFLVKTFVVRSFYIPSASMENTLLIKDRILVDELTPKFGQYSRGDVVVFRDPGGWLPPSPTEQRSPVVEGADWVLSLFGLSAPDSDDHLIKRVIGTAGDHVVCCNALGQTTVNGVPLDESYVRLAPGRLRPSPFPTTSRCPTARFGSSATTATARATRVSTRISPGRASSPSTTSWDARSSSRGRSRASA